MFALIALVASLGLGILIAMAAQLAAVDGLWIGSWLFLTGFMAAQIIAPGRMIEWRARMMAGTPAPMQALGLEALGQAYNTLFGIGTTADARSKRNMRLLGVILLVASTFVIAFMWLAFHLLGIG